MLEDDSKKSHLRFRVRVAGLRSMAARANAFSASEKVRNNPKVEQAISDAHKKTARKRKLGETSLQEKRKQQKKTERIDTRANKLVERGEGCHQSRTH
jgi:hypothetical protein